MSNRSIAFTLVIVFLFLIFLIIGVGGLGLHAMNEANFEARNIAAQQWKDVQLSGAVLDYSNRNHEINIRLFLSDHPADVNALIAERTKNSAQISNLFSILQTRVDSPREQESLDAVLAARKAYLASYQNSTNLLLAGKKADARESQIHNTLPLLGVYYSALRDFATFQTWEMNQQLASSTVRYRTAYKEVAVMVISSVLLALAIAAFVIHRVVIEIRRRQRAEQGLRKLNSELEAKILQRTANLEESNRHLSSEIAERKRTEALVRRLSTAVEQSPALVTITDLSGRITYVNRKFIECTGYGFDEVVGKNPRILKSGHTKPEEYGQLWRTITAGKEWRGEFCNRRKNGELYWESAVICPIREEDSTISHFLAIKEDITDRKRTEKQYLLTKSSLDNASVSVLWVNPQGHILYANETACRSLGWSREELTSLSIPDIDPLFPAEKWPDFWKELKMRRAMTFETQQKHKEGRILPIEVTASFLEFDGQEYLFAFARDISERRMIQAQLQQAQKMESIGQLAAGIAHEINTPTQFVTDNLLFLRDSWKSTSELMDLYRSAIRDHSGVLPQSLSNTVHQAERTCDLDFIITEVPRAIDHALDGASRVSEIVRAMKTFAHPDSLDKTATDLNRDIESTITVARNEWRYIADVVTELDDTLPPVVCYPGDINQVLLNLLVNAAHAIHEKNKNADKGRIAVRTRRHGNFVEISVADTGTGIREDIRNKIFDPFFTTKQVGKGTGQGLAIGYALIVKKHLGRLRFETEMGVGTTFFIDIPIDPSEHATESRAASTGASD